jgi:hypothetical protein
LKPARDQARTPKSFRFKGMSIRMTGDRSISRTALPYCYLADAVPQAEQIVSVSLRPATRVHVTDCVRAVVPQRHSDSARGEVEDRAAVLAPSSLLEVSVYI